MPKEEWGTKRICPTTGKRFYDLGRSPVVSPYTGEVVDIEAASRKMSVVMSSPAAKKKSAAVVEDIDDEAGLLDDDDTAADVGDDILEDDSDDTVSLDELADVPADEDEG